MKIVTVHRKTKSENNVLFICNLQYFIYYHQSYVQHFYVTAISYRLVHAFHIGEQELKTDP